MYYSISISVLIGIVWRSSSLSSRSQQSFASDESCALVQDVLQEYEVILQLHIALTYTVHDAVKLSNYYNSLA